MHNGFDALQLHANRLRGVTIPDLLAAELKRPEQYARQVGPLYFNFARQKYDCVALEALFALARNHNVTGAFQRMFCGEQVNVTEGVPCCILRCAVILVVLRWRLLLTRRLLKCASECMR